MVETIAVISDLHWGSKSGLGNEWVQDKFKEFLKRVPKGAIGIINGDVFQGIDPRWIDAIDEGDFNQLTKGKVYDIISKFYDRCKEVYSTSGTKSHSYAGFVNIEKLVLSFWGSKVHKAQLSMQSKKTKWRILFQHGTSQAMVYRTGLLERELRFAHEKAFEGLMSDIDCLVRSHSHYLVSIHRYKDCGIITPCFQLPHDYSESGSIAWKPVIGGLLIHLEDTGDIYTGIKFEPITFKLPEEFLKAEKF